MFVGHDFKKRINRKQVVNFESQIVSKHKADAHKICGYALVIEKSIPIPWIPLEFQFHSKKSELN
jgi:hypothetical protein